MPLTGIARVSTETILLCSSSPGYLRSLGNLIIGYSAFNQDLVGSHSLVIGDGHAWTGAGALVVGSGHTVSADGAVAIGGMGNTASGNAAVVIGGSGSTAGHALSTVLNSPGAATSAPMESVY